MRIVKKFIGQTWKSEVDLICSVGQKLKIIEINEVGPLSVLMRRLVCAFVICIQQNHFFLKVPIKLENVIC